MNLLLLEIATNGECVLRVKEDLSYFTNANTHDRRSSLSLSVDYTLANKQKSECEFCLSYVRCAN